jgi:anthranilate phosphoribosyltransferase
MTTLSTASQASQAAPATPTPSSPQPLIGRLVEGQNLTAAEMQAAMGGIMDGQWTPAQIAGFLIALRIKGETAEEIAAAAQVLRHKSVTVPAKRRPLVDTCGTGGDHSGTFNVSTGAAIVAAAAGSAIAKHGNRAVSSRCGSANVLQELGISLELTPEQVSRCVDEVGIGFLYAPKLHPAMKHVIGPRQELGQRTLFNIMGPLLNPAGAKRQVLGVFRIDLVRPLAEVLQTLGSEHVLVVAGTDGLDEISLAAPTRIAELRHDHIEEYVLNPEDLGLSLAAQADLQGGDLAENANILRQIFAGQKGGAMTAKRDIVALNAAAALYVGGLVPNLKVGVAKALSTIDSGAAAKTLAAWVALSQSLASEAA